MKSEKGQSLVMVGVALFLLAGLCLYLGLSQPKISSGVLVETPTTRCSPVPRRGRLPPPLVDPLQAERQRLRKPPLPATRAQSATR